MEHGFRVVYGSAELNFIHQLADQRAIYFQNAGLYKQVSRAKQEWEETFKAVNFYKGDIIFAKYSGEASVVARNLRVFVKNRKCAILEHSFQNG